MEENVRVMLEGLNPAQREAVESVDGPVLIIAGAGSGKTRVLTTRIAYMLAQGTDPSRVLALTFTRKAAGEMKERIALMVGERKARALVMGTFHSVFIKFLRDYAASLGYPERFTIYDTSDSLSAVKSCLKELGLDEKVYKPKTVLSRISKVKNDLITVGEYKSRPEYGGSDFKTSTPRLAEVYDLYQKKLKQSGVMDFDDILVNTNLLLRDNPQALSAISGRFTHILVDEYQDTNYAQYVILRALASPHSNICVVGDDSQSIYAFRGARVENILNFHRNYPSCRTFRLEQNYRSTQTIVGAANSVIAHNDARIPKKCFSAGDEGEKIRITTSSNESDEARSIAISILDRIRSAGARYEDFAVLYRTNAQSRSLEDQLRHCNIPYRIYSGNAFYDRAEVKDFMAYFKMAVNPSDDESFRRIYNRPARGIGDTTFEQIEKASRVLGCSLLQVAYTPGVSAVGLEEKVLRKVKVFTDMVVKWHQDFAVTDAFEMARRIAEESGLYAFYKADNSVEGLSRAANVEELLNSVQQYVEDREVEYSADNADSDVMPVFHLDEYLESTVLLTGVDASEEGMEDADNKVALMTVHSAKGLEFPYVYIAGMEDHLFPSYQDGTSITREDLEEERRLFYVALTRAKKSVALTHAISRIRNGGHQNYPLSRFVREIDPQYLQNPPREAGAFGSGFGSGFGRAFGGTPRQGFGSRPSASPVSRMQAAPAQKVATAPDPDFAGVHWSTLKAGQRIEHNAFGSGRILSIDTSRKPDVYAKVEFDHLGLKTLNLTKAKVRPVK